MGGTVTVVIRESDGTEHRMQRWTNSLPWGICNARMIKEDRNHIDQYLSQWKEMETDWNKNHKTGKFELNMTDVYFPSVGFQPINYGFVLLDFKTKHLLSMQGYTHVDKILPPRLSFLMEEDKEDILVNLCELARDNRILSIESWDSKQKKLITEPVPEILKNNPSIDDIKSFLDLNNTDIGRVSHINVDWSPFTVIDYEFNKDLDVRDAYLKVKELDFILNKDEETGWQEWISEREQQEDET